MKLAMSASKIKNRPMLQTCKRHWSGSIYAMDNSLSGPIDPFIRFMTPTPIFVLNLRNNQSAAQRSFARLRTWELMIWNMEHFE
eukprot:113567-Amphidinium_carterae.1